jgi:RimJ/RimL family protein N-acetyltransferase
MKSIRIEPSANEVRLRAVEKSDLSTFYEQQHEPEANRLANFPARELDSFKDHWEKILNDASVVKQTILLGSQVAGNIVSFEQSGRRLVGYWLGIDFWGRGVATAALSQFLVQERYRPLHAFVSRENTGSIRVLQKCGFNLESSDAADEYLFTLKG